MCFSYQEFKWQFGELSEFFRAHIHKYSLNFGPHPRGRYLCLRVIGLLDAALPVASSKFFMREVEVPQGEKNLP